MQALAVAAVGSAAAAETGGVPEADGTTAGADEPDASAATPEAPSVEAGAAAPVAEAATAVLVAADEATPPPVAAAARTEETEVQAGFLERFSSYRQASP